MNTLSHPSRGAWVETTINGEPWGDTVYSSMRIALEAELRDGYQIVDAREFPTKISSAESLP